MTKEKHVHEPLFQVSKRGELPLWKAVLIRASAVVIGLLLCGIICSVLFKANFFEIYAQLFDGAVGNESKTWILLRDLALLLGVGIALVPSFKMKFWNLGGNGQVLVGILATVACMYYMGGKVARITVIICMVISSILAGAIWAVIPAIFKAIFKTNESLFTLMMNYIATGLTLYCINEWAKEGSGTLKPIVYGHLPSIGGNQYLLIILVVAALTAFMYFYMKYSKHGYEIAVVGESEKTAKYAGINVKKTVIRTLILSGAICGVIGLLIGGAMDHTIYEGAERNMGFTAIMVAWLAKFNPLMMILTSFIVTFLSKGMAKVQSANNVTNSSVANFIIAIVYFCIIACEFFIAYKVKMRKINFKKGGDFINPTPSEENAKKEDK